MSRGVAQAGSPVFYGVVAAPTKIPRLADIPESERTPTLIALLAICTQQQEEIHRLKEQVQGLKDEIARLKGHKPKPTIRPSTLEKGGGGQAGKGPRPGSAKRRKNRKLNLHKTVNVPPDTVPEGSRFKGYQDFTVQDIVLQPHNTVYRLERWVTPDGQQLVGKLPKEAGDGHFGSTLVSFILYQYYHCDVTQPLLWEQLVDLGVDISTGQVNRIIIEGKEVFHQEKAEILRVGLEVSRYVHVDDTGARHQGKNGYCTHVGNELFAYFESTRSKSRINFLEVLRGDHDDYVVSDVALDFMRAQKLPYEQLEHLCAHQDRRYEGKEVWQALLWFVGITDERHVRIATEGALLGSVLDHGVNPELAIMSDDAGQFNLVLLLHVLCWIHAERLLAKLVGFNDGQREDLKRVRSQVWDLYQLLKLYKHSPSDGLKAEVSERFDAIFTQKTCFETLNQALKRLHRNKSELLAVLEHPELPLHNNLSEGDIRGYVKKRKISGSTRSDDGRRCRDTFASVKKTCRKLGVSFWSCLKDRVSGRNIIAPLSEMIRQRAQEALG